MSDAAAMLTSMLISIFIPIFIGAAFVAYFHQNYLGVNTARDDRHGDGVGKMMPLASVIGKKHDSIAKNISIRLHMSVNLLIQD